jgi:hypothetical protein
MYGQRRTVLSVTTGNYLSESAIPGETGDGVASVAPRAWFLTGVVMFNCSLVYLIVLGDLSARALLNGSLASRPLAIHLAAAAAIFAAAALLGGLIVYRHGRENRPRLS